MKKILFGVLCTSACAAVASEEQEVSTVVSTIEVRAISSSLTNVVVAVPGLDLASDSPIAISNLIKTQNLAKGDRLVAFTDNKYEGWVLNESKVWEKTPTLIDVTPTGIVNRVGTSASLKTLGVGSGIWLSRTASGTANPFYVYARQPSSTNSTVAAGSAALVGNPTTADKSPSISSPNDKDQIIVPSDSTLTGYKKYTYLSSTSKWTSIDSSNNLEQSPTPPSIDRGTGFWYVSKGSSAVTINWAN